MTMNETLIIDGLILKKKRERGRERRERDWERQRETERDRERNTFAKWGNEWEILTKKYLYHTCTQYF